MSSDSVPRPTSIETGPGDTGSGRASPQPVTPGSTGDGAGGEGGDGGHDSNPGSPTGRPSTEGHTRSAAFLSPSIESALATQLLNYENLPSNKAQLKGYEDDHTKAKKVIVDLLEANDTTFTEMVQLVHLCTVHVRDGQDLMNEQLGTLHLAEDLKNKRQALEASGGTLKEKTEAFKDSVSQGDSGNAETLATVIAAMVSDKKKHARIVAQKKEARDKKNETRDQKKNARDEKLTELERVKKELDKVEKEFNQAQEQYESAQGELDKAHENQANSAKTHGDKVDKEYKKYKAAVEASSSGDSQDTFFNDLDAYQRDVDGYTEATKNWHDGIPNQFAEVRRKLGFAARSLGSLFPANADGAIFPNAISQLLDNAMGLKDQIAQGEFAHGKNVGPLLVKIGSGEREAARRRRRAPETTDDEEGDE